MFMKFNFKFLVDATTLFKGIIQLLNDKMHPYGFKLKISWSPLEYWMSKTFIELHYRHQGLSQDFETGCLKLAIVKFWGVQTFRGYHNILRLQP